MEKALCNIGDAVICRRLEAANRTIGKLKEALRVNALRHIPGASHADIDAVIAECERT